MRRTQKVDAVLRQLHSTRDRGEDDGFSPPSHVTPEGWIYRADTQCFVEGLRYDFVNRHGQLAMRDGSSNDMTGAIQLFRAIDANVAAIDTFSGDKVNACYRKIDGKWGAFRPVTAEDVSEGA